ncbi:hypothetical protein P0O24_09065 [Methanotrichaceae archaeon M04Ac]|uniref:Uncharacterized protein n=1 Tax=Candidatus Methanocrinis alkalitolerans TaxID=3033395 RepID=A0ABT5XG83_9EURY|nr:hypothetical protein [Candidatus Methanocrinis alkalitolerans]MCR3884838.1 hypothetical protein [Methanothrix sp.]MDF0593733.1 hypothetical protein [Candidatus Methanocrinis alkalitolerans]
MRTELVILLLAGLISSASAASYTFGVDNVTDGSSFWISRQSANMSFDLSGSVEGDILPIAVTPAGRVLSPFISGFADLAANDVRLRERTAALQGTYSSEGVVSLRSEAEADVNRTYFKPAGSDLWTITLEENWPVTLNATKTLDYIGKGINDRDCAGNNGDSVGASFLYNRELSRERNVALRLDRLNATVVATNDTIVRADVFPTRSTLYDITSHSTGIADLRYRQTDSRGDLINLGEERYTGTYDITRKVEMVLIYTNETNNTDWLSCCVSGCDVIDPCMLASWGEAGVFDCVCR